MADVHTLTAAEIKAIKACRTITVRSILDEGGSPANSSATVRIIGGDAESKVETTFSTRATATYYGDRDAEGPRFSYGRCDAHIDHYPSQVTPVGTIVELLKTGDDISFCWGIGAFTSPAMGELKVNGDILYLNARRPGKNMRYEKVMKFVIETHISTNHLTRMIQPRQ